MIESSFWKIYATPISIAFMSIIGLVSALLGDGVWDIVAWSLLGVTILIGVKRVLKIG